MFESQKIIFTTIHLNDFECLFAIGKVCIIPCNSKNIKSINLTHHFKNRLQYKVNVDGSGTGPVVDGSNSRVIVP